MVNVLLIPTSGLMEFNASAAAGGASATLDNAYANAVRMEIANSATLRFTGKNATDNRRIHVSGTNGDLMLVRDINVTSTASATMETPSVSSTKVSGVSAFFDTISAANYIGNLGTGQFVDVTGDTMTGRLDLSAAASSTTVLSANGAVFVSGNVTVSSNISAVGEMSSTGAHRGSSGIFTTTVQAPTISGTTGTFGTQVTAPTVSGTTGTFATQVTSPTVSGTTGTFATQVTAPTVSGTTGTFATQVVSPTVSGGTLTVTGNASVTGTVSSTGNQLAVGDMSSTGSHRGLSGIFTHTVSAATALIAPAVSATTEVSAPTVKGISLSGGTLVLSGTVNATGNISSAGEISSTGAHRGSSGIFTHTVSAATALIAPAVSATTEVSAPTVKGTSLSGGSLVVTGNVSGATFSGAALTLTGNASVANLSATGNVSSASAFALSSVVSSASAGSLSATNISALTNLRGGNVSAATVTGLSGTFPTVSANTLQATSIVAGLVSGVAGTDISIQIASVGVGTITLSSAQTNVSGPLSVNGHFAATSKAFLIDHPTPAKKEAGMKLQYACLEGPENGVYVRGKADTQVGVIELPDYWMDLVHADSITVQLTAMSPAQRLYVAKIEDNKVYVRDASAVSEVTTFFYTVNGERKDIDHLTIEY
jgi:hypothetical protein